MGGAPPAAAQGLHFAVGASIAEVERRLIFATLESCAGNKRQAADLLGVSLKTLYNRLNAYRELEIDTPALRETRSTARGFPRSTTGS
jgi:DNA-binding NtrC family response regulator